MPDMIKSSVINLEVHSTLRQMTNSSRIEEDEENSLSHCEITKTLDVFCKPTRRPLRITHSFHY